MSDRFVRLHGFRTLFVVLAALLLLLPMPALLAPEVSAGARLVVLAPLVLAALWMALRVSGCGVRDDGEHLVVRNPLRTVRIPWHDVEGIELGRFGVMPKVGIRRADGSAVGIAGLPVAANGADADASTLRLIEQMKAKAAATRTGRTA